MALREKIDNNIITVLVVVSIAVAGTTFLVVNYWNEQQLNNLEQFKNFELAKLESKLASIERDVPGIKYFDVRKILYSANNANTISPTLNYFENDEFYAPKSDEYWSYSKTNEIEFLKQVTGKGIYGGLFDVYLSKYPVHLWEANETFEMINQEKIFNLFPYIFLQKLSYHDLRKILRVWVSYDRWRMERHDYVFNEEDLKQSTDTDENLMNITQAIHDDPVGFLFSSLSSLGFQSSVKSSNETYTIKKVQKKENVLYSQSTTKYAGVKVSGEITTVYVQQEIMIISDKKGIYLIKIYLPSKEPVVRNFVYANVNNWLTSVKLLMN
jgi:hypothetical protein